jgi:hypothetical protein
LLTGLYLAEICMIGLCAIRGAIGPVIIFDIIYEEEVVSVGLVNKIKPEEGKSQNQRCNA